MIVTAHRIRSIGWLALLGLCSAMVLVLAFRVNALKADVRRSENRIVALKQEKMYLETEFETRANQQQLEAWNDLDFGYVAPAAQQYLEGERQLAALGKPAGPDAPAPIRVASADDAVAAQAAFPAMVSPLTGKAVGAAQSEGEARTEPAATVRHAAEVRPVKGPLESVASGADLGKRLTLLSTDDGALRRPAVDKSADKLAHKPASAKVKKASAGDKGAAEASHR